MLKARLNAHSGTKSSCLKALLSALCLLWLSSPLAHADDAALADLFRNANVTGTLVIESVKTGQRFVHDAARARQAYPAASTFKILHTLIALEEKVVTSAETVISWDGTRHEMEAWNRDQTLASAFKVSCVWCYQSFARRIDRSTYRAHLREAQYGTLSEPFDVTQFWLDGSLTISAEAQIVFQRQLVERRLPYRASSYETLKTVMQMEAAPGVRLYAKTGWSARRSPGIGWFVGYVETADDSWLFALNLDTRSAEDLPLRQKIALAGLRAKGILPHLPDELKAKLGKLERIRLHWSGIPI